MAPYQEEVDSYLDSVFALIGMLLLIKFDGKDERTDVAVYQGVRITCSDEDNPNGYITPDFCAYDDRMVLIGEVKVTLPNNVKHWSDTEEQIRKYIYRSIVLDGRRSSDHDICLVVHIDKSQRVKEEMEVINESDRVCVIEYTRTEQAKSFAFLKLCHGEFRFCNLGNRLKYGISVPRNVEAFSIVKVYDAKPPLPYLMQIIWEKVIACIAFERIAGTKKRTENVKITLNDISKEINENYSFRALSWCNKEGARMPALVSHIREACSVFVEGGHARWIDATSREEIEFKYRTGEVDILAWCIDLCERKKETQLTLDLDK